MPESYRLPLNQHAAPRDAAAEGGEQDKVAFLNHPLLYALVERDGDGRGRSVAVVRDVRVDDCRVYVQARSYAVRDALVRLMRDEELNVFGLVARLAQNLRRNVGHRAHGYLEKLVALHLEVVHPRSERVGRRRYARAAARRVELFGEAPVGVYARREYAALAFGRAEHGRARAVAEEHAGRAVAVVNVARENLRAYDERVTRLARANHRVGHRQAVEEAGARGDEVERRGAVRAQLGLNQTARRGEYLVGRDGRADDEADVRGVNLRALDCLPRGGDGEERGVLALLRAVALLDAGARRNPVVRGLDHVFEVGVCQDAFGVRAPRA